VSALLSKTKSIAQHGGRPPAAVELGSEGVLAAALPGKNDPPVFAFAALRAGVLIPGIAEPNLREPGAVAEAIRTALGDVSPRTRSVTLIVPDTSVRVFVLDFDSLPAQANEVIPVLRFRLRKMVPFDAEHAGVSYQVLSQDKNECRVLTAVMPAVILQEYEEAVRAAGYEPGVVMPSSLAALAAIDSEDAVLTACLSHVSLTTSITKGDDLLLYRTLELPDDPAQRLQEVQRDIAVAAAYFEDRLARRPRRLRYGGVGAAQDFAGWIKDPELEVVDLAARPSKGAATSMGIMSVAGISGALAGAR
jgi:type IV pilus assembly protein PilM